MPLLWMSIASSSSLLLQELTYAALVFLVSVSNIHWFTHNPFLLYSLCSLLSAVHLPSLCLPHPWAVSSVQVHDPPPPPPRPPPCPPGPLNYQGSLAAGHTKGDAEGA